MFFLWFIFLYRYYGGIHIFILFFYERGILKIYSKIYFNSIFLFLFIWLLIAVLFVLIPLRQIDSFHQQLIGVLFGDFFWKYVELCGLYWGTYGIGLKGYFFLFFWQYWLFDSLGGFRRHLHYTAIGIPLMRFFLR